MCLTSRLTSTVDILSIKTFGIFKSALLMASWVHGRQYSHHLENPVVSQLYPVATKACYENTKNLIGSTLILRFMALIQKRRKTEYTSKCNRAIRCYFIHSLSTVRDTTELTNSDEPFLLILRAGIVRPKTVTGHQALKYATSRLIETKKTTNSQQVMQKGHPTAPF